VKVVAGEAQGVVGAISKRVTEPVFLDLELPYAAAFPGGHNAFIYVYEGALKVGDRGVLVAEGRMGILTTDPAADGVLLAGTEPSRVLLLAGRPAPRADGTVRAVAAAEIRQAVEDGAAGRLGAIPPRSLAVRKEIE
jgi:redox-sensitive bicupin YhaK (pirin superfamily)